MLGFITALIGDPKTMLESIRAQNKVGFKGFFQKVMFEEMPYYLKNAGEKSALQIITPQQSIFLFVRDSHEKILLTLLEFIYNKKMDDYQDSIGAPKEIANCIKLGNIYIKEYDFDLEPIDSTPKKKTIFNRILNKIKGKPERYFYIFIPKYINRYQYDELMRIIEIKNQFNEIFGEDNFALIHYIDDELNQKVEYEGEDVQNFLEGEEIKEFIRKVEIIPEEQIIVDTNRAANSTNTRNVVDRVDTKPVVVETAQKEGAKHNIEEEQH